MPKSREWTESFHPPAQRKAYIQHICEHIAEAYQPEKIILFGSHAYGQPTPESDVDLLVVMPFEGGYFRQATKIRRLLALPIPLDLVVRTPGQLQHRLAIGDRFIGEAVERGKVMYEAAHN
jgi:uncharacterized protein